MRIKLGLGLSLVILVGLIFAYCFTSYEIQRKDRLAVSLASINVGNTLEKVSTELSGQVSWEEIPPDRLKSHVLWGKNEAHVTSELSGYRLHSPFDTPLYHIVVFDADQKLTNFIRVEVGG